MDNTSGIISGDSPFHAGEQAIQNRLGVREEMERFGRKVIRDYMPVQHREFFSQLSYLFVGYADQQGWPWASILIGEPGFIASNSPNKLTIDARPVPGDGLEAFLDQALSSHAEVGLLGVDLATRRRNRISAHVVDVLDGSVELQVDQSFGNCPQYIQTRHMQIDRNDESPPDRIGFTELVADAVRLIHRADTFFVSSYVSSVRTGRGGVDLSHRGGRPGFIRVDDRHTLTIPDYRGNFHFNTLGNFIENPRAGLLFIDFISGDILSLTGTTEIVWDTEETALFKGAERLWRFRLDHGYWLKKALPISWAFGEYSAYSLATGTWSELQLLETSTLPRNVDENPVSSEQPPVAEQAIVEFRKSGVEQPWVIGDGTLLEFAEKQGLTPEYGCRTGKCGACKTTLVSGSVSYVQPTSAKLRKNEVLLCCALPSVADSDTGEIPVISVQV